MKVFLSWSGERSRRVAMILREWLPQVIQVLDPYVSSEDIDKGARWSVDIAKELEASLYGIICVTPDNLEAPWINFEAGALAKTLEKGRVVPLLIGMRPTDVAGPLVQFQATIAEKEDLWKLVASLNQQCGESKLDEGRLRKAFDKWWPDLEKRIDEELKRSPESAKRPASAGSRVLEEILELVRVQQKQIGAMQEQLERFVSRHDTQRNYAIIQRRRMPRITIRIHVNKNGYVAAFGGQHYALSEIGVADVLRTAGFSPESAERVLKSKEGAEFEFRVDPEKALNLEVVLDALSSARAARVASASKPPRETFSDAGASAPAPEG